MQFLNSAIDVSSLPAVEALDLHPVQPSYQRLLKLEWWLTALVLAAFTGALIYFVPSLHEGLKWLYLVAAYLLIVGMLLLPVLVSFPFLSYAVREKDVILQKGWIIRSLKICPFNRIQNCSLKTGPLERRFGLASLVIYTAGSDGADLRIPGLLQEEADRLRHYILQQIHAENDQHI